MVAKDMTASDVHVPGELGARRARRLRNLKISEASLVDRPANEGATVLLFKRDGEKQMTHDQNIEKLIQDFGVDKVIKSFVENDSHAFSQEEVHKILHAGAQRERRDGESQQQSFARYFTEQSERGRLRRIAYQKAARPIDINRKPERVGEDAMEIDPTAPLSVLRARAQEFLVKYPNLSTQQAFARAAQKYPELLASAIADRRIPENVRL